MGHGMSPRSSGLFLKTGVNRDLRNYSGFWEAMMRVLCGYIYKGESLSFRDIY